MEIRSRVAGSGLEVLRLVEDEPRVSLDELPEKPEDLEKLARRLGFEPGAPGSAGQQFLAELERYTTQTRELFLKLVAQERQPPSPAAIPARAGVSTSEL